MKTLDVCELTQSEMLNVQGGGVSISVEIKITLNIKF
jgi:hypothetical protein